MRMHGRLAVLTLSVLFAAVNVAPASAAATASPPDVTYVTNGPVQAVLRAGDSIYVGGQFDRVGPRTGPGVEVGLDGSQHHGIPEVAGAGATSLLGSGGAINAVAADGAGGWYIGGLFSHVGGLERSNVAHILADHSVDPAFDAAVNDAVEALVVSGSKVYIGGRFTTIDGQARNNIAALNSDGTLSSFNPDANGPVAALALSPDAATLYAGGRFTLIGGLPRLSLAALNTADGRATVTFNPTVTGTSGNGVVDALALSGSALYVGGSFSSLGGLPRTNIGAVSVGLPLDGVGIREFDPSPSRSGCAACGSVAALAVAGSTVYAGGMFDTIGGQPRQYLAGLRAADGTATAFNPAPNGNIFAVTVAGSTVYASGGFRSTGGSPSIGGAARNYVAALDGTSGTATAFDPNPNRLVHAIGVSPDAIYLGGSFSSLGGEVRNGLAALSAVDGSVTSFNPNAQGFNGGLATVYALAVSGTTIYAGGYFGSIGGETRNGLAALNATDGSATSWNPRASYGAGPAIIETLAVSDATVYAGGVFDTIGGAARNNLGEVRMADAAATGWNPQPNSVVESVVLSGDVVYAGGFFTNIGGKTRNKIAALNTTTGGATSWNPDATATAVVLDIAVAGSTVYVGGNFPSIGGIARPNIAGIRVSDGTPTAFNPKASDPASGGGVYALAVRGSTVYAAGFFSQIGGQTRHLVAGLDGATGDATSFDPHGAPGFGAYALATYQDKLYVGGSFDTFDLARQQGFAQFSLQD
jgi:hypothetical protein